MVYDIVMDVCTHAQPITFVEPNSPAARKDVRAGDVLLAINGTPVCDLIDYEALTCARALELSLLRDGAQLAVVLHKDEYEPLGLCFDTTLMSRMQTCKNHCIFCFIDQMPKGVRSSLCVKDDDWRLSFIMGNYVSLTNVDDAEFARILQRRVSPLYVSVHATDPAVRTRIMANPSAGRLMERLHALKAAGLRFHTQIVLCRGVNDGAVLQRTLDDLASLAPACGSVAIVPVGVTRFREGLFPIVPFDAAASAAVVSDIAARQAAYLVAMGTRFVFLSDEWYLNAGLPIPQNDAYEGYDQIENGVGLLRLFAEDFTAALAERVPRKTPRTFSMAGGTAAYPFFAALYQALKPYGVALSLHPIENRFFGGNVHVAGLLTGQDLLVGLANVPLGDTLLIPQNMLREQEAVFLDDKTITEIEQALGVRIRVYGDGAQLISILFEE